MGRAAIHKDEFTPFGLWIKEYGDPCMTVTNVDYLFMKIFEQSAIVMLLEEKTNGGQLYQAQRMAMRFLHNQLSRNNDSTYDFGKKWGQKKIEYWGFYVLEFGKGKTMPGPGMLMNKKEITTQSLADHISFVTKFCEGYFDNESGGDS